MMPTVALQFGWIHICSHDRLSNVKKKEKGIMGNTPCKSSSIKRSPAVVAVDCHADERRLRQQAAAVRNEFSLHDAPLALKQVLLSFSFDEERLCRHANAGHSRHASNSTAVSTPSHCESGIIELSVTW